MLENYIQKLGVLISSNSDAKDYFAIKCWLYVTATVEEILNSRRNYLNSLIA